MIFFWNKYIICSSWRYYPLVSTHPLSAFNKDWTECIIPKGPTSAVWSVALQGCIYTYLEIISKLFFVSLFLSIFLYNYSEFLYIILFDPNTIIFCISNEFKFILFLTSNWFKWDNIFYWTVPTKLYHTYDSLEYTFSVTVCLFTQYSITILYITQLYYVEFFLLTFFLFTSVWVCHHLSLSYNLIFATSFPLLFWEDVN